MLQGGRLSIIISKVRYFPHLGLQEKHQQKYLESVRKCIKEAISTLPRQNILVSALNILSMINFLKTDSMKLNFSMSFMENLCQLKN
jgi:hypothetical protein